MAKNVFESIGKAKVVRDCKKCGGRFTAHNANRYYCRSCRG